MADNVAIKVENLSKTFKLPHEKTNSVKSLLINFRKRRTYETQQALKDVSFEIKKGEFFGIVGRNGSGKSTLLKLLAGIYTPTAGKVRVSGKLTPFIELGVGFNPELTGRENVFLNGSLLGFNRKEMDAMYDDIVEFAELERFMDQKLKNYSSGMQVRLAFSIAIRAESDILVLDEVLAVGDEAFQRKCNDYFENIKKAGKTIILVTHTMDNIERFCNRAVLIENGEVKLIGSPEAVANQYKLDNLNSSPEGQNAPTGLSQEISYIKVVPESKKMLTRKDDLEFRVEYISTTERPIYIGISLFYNGIPVVEHNTRKAGVTTEKNVKQKFRYVYPLKHFNAGEFLVGAAAFDAETKKLLGFTSENSSCRFVVKNPDVKMGGLLYEQGKWSRQK